MDDNPHLPDAYKRNFSVLAHTDPALYKAHRHGDWSAIVGDYFGDRYRKTLINDCADVFDMLGVSYDRDALEDAMQRLKRRGG